jgi:DNA (cytosine-5)-methyltransferase 1
VLKTAVLGEIGKRDWWSAEPDVGRVAHGVSARVDRLRALGNAIVPQIAEVIGRAIMARGG